MPLRRGGFDPDQPGALPRPRTARGPGDRGPGAASLPLLRARPLRAGAGLDPGQRPPGNRPPPRHHTFGPAPRRSPGAGGTGGDPHRPRLPGNPLAHLRAGPRCPRRGDGAGGGPGLGGSLRLPPGAPPACPCTRCRRPGHQRAQDRARSHPGQPGLRPDGPAGAGPVGAGLRRHPHHQPGGIHPSQHRGVAGADVGPWGGAPGSGHGAGPRRPAAASGGAPWGGSTG